MNITKNLILTPYLILSNGTKIDETQQFEPYGYRTMWNIVWSCTLTIIACTWATIHSNVPSHRCSPSKLYYKVQLWIVDLIMPELLLLWATKQFFAARNLALEGKAQNLALKEKGIPCRWFPRLCPPQNVSNKEEDTTKQDDSSPLIKVSDKEKDDTSDSTTTHDPSSSLIRGSDKEGDHTSDLKTTQDPSSFLIRVSDKERDDTSDWTMPQAFFALMGGFEDKAGLILSPYASVYRITKSTDEEIWDKSKRNSFVKVLALVQTSWFLLVTIYRIQSPMLFATEAEIVTCTFGFLSFITNIFWWNKPQGVDLPLTVATNPNPISQNPQATTDDRKDVPPPNCFELATSMLQYGNTPKHDEFIPKPDVYAYAGELTLDNMTIAVLCASLCGSLSGIFHLVVASLNRGLITTTHARIWFSFAFLGFSLPFYLLLVVFIAFGLRARDKEIEMCFLDYALDTRVQQVFLIASVIGRIALIVALIYFMFTPYDYTAFLTPNWSHYIPHPF